jgi:hypothetical protein
MNIQRNEAQIASTAASETAVIFEKNLASPLHDNKVSRASKTSQTSNPKVINPARLKQGFLCDQGNDWRKQAVSNEWIK